MIVSGTLQPGARITERQLSADTGMGLTPVREALTRLSQERLVLTLPRRGYVVAPITSKGVNDLFEIWRYICGAIAELAVRKADSGDLDRICRVFADEAGPPLNDTDPLARVGRGNAMFELLLSVARNDLMTDVYTQLSTQVARLFVIVFQHDEVPSGSAGGMSLADAARRRNGSTVRDLVMGYNDLVHHLVLELLRTQELGQTPAAYDAASVRTEAARRGPNSM
jgi:DNA-binding GntR family transcriptional regulator